MRLSVVFLLVVLLSHSKNSNAEFRQAFGAGTQFAGLAGYQLSYAVSDTRFRASLGFIGAVVGVEHLVGDSFGFGIQAGGAIALIGVMVFGNYYFNGSSQEGIYLGIETCLSCIGILSSSDPRAGGVALSIGYSF